jgi:hypothetical protein
VRTAIFLGLIYIGDAIRAPSYVATGNVVVAVTAIISGIFVVMDAVDFFHNKKPANQPVQPTEKLGG